MFVQEIRWPRLVWAALVSLFLGSAVPSLILALLATERGTLRKILPVLTVGTVGIVLIVVWIFGTLKVEVDRQTLTVGFGPFRERISLEKVVACDATTYRWIDWGGFGIRVASRGKLYNVPGDGGVAVRVTLNDGRQILFSSTDPEAVCRALRMRNPEIRSAVS